jgi:hypothetical protein
MMLDVHAGTVAKISGNAEKQVVPSLVLKEKRPGGFEERARIAISLTSTS